MGVAFPYFGEDDVSRLLHGCLSAVHYHHRIVHQLIVQLPPVVPAGTHGCRQGEGRGRLRGGGHIVRW